MPKHPLFPSLDITQQTFTVTLAETVTTVFQITVAADNVSDAENVASDILANHPNAAEASIQSEKLISAIYTTETH